MEAGTYKKIKLTVALFTLLGILVLAVVLRLYKITTPLVEFHSWRQADTAAVARNFVQNGINLLKPQYDDLSHLQTGKENPQGLRMVEVPIYNALIALSYKALPVFAVEVHGRFVSLLASLIIIICLFYLLWYEAGFRAAIAGSLAFAAMPFTVFYTRAVLPETTAMAFTMLGLWAVYFAYRKKNMHLPLLLMGAISLSLGVLVKPVAIFFVLPFFYILYRAWGMAFLSKLVSYVAAVVIVGPLIWWRSYIQQFPEGIPANTWLITSVNVNGMLQPIFMRPAFFRWIFFERIGILISGIYLLPFIVSGIFARTRTWFLQWIIAASFLYVFVFQGGNVQHEYYQIIILPALALLTGMGFAYFYENARSFYGKTKAIAAASLLFVFAWVFAFYKVEGNYYQGSDIPSIARTVQSLTDKNDKIVTDTGGDTTVLYAFNRKGAPAIYKTPPQLKELGYKYLFTYDGAKAQSLAREYNLRILFSSNTFTLLEL